MKFKTGEIIIGKGNGISKFLSDSLNINLLPASELKNINLSEYKNIIYTSSDPSINLENVDIANYLEKNIINIYNIVNSDFKGSFTYISSIDSGFYEVYNEKYNNQKEELFTPYSFSKYSVELLLTKNKNFKECNILRLGAFWPAKKTSNLHKAIYSNPEDIKLNLKSFYYVTPYSLLVHFIKKKLPNKKNKFTIGYLTSSNKISLSDLLKIRNLNYQHCDNKKFLYHTRSKDKDVMNLMDYISFDWEKEKDFNSIIGDALNLNNHESILPSRKKIVT